MRKATHFRNSTSFKSIIQVGATGSLGGPIFNALVSAGAFEVSVLARPSSKSVYPEGINVFKAEFSDHQALVEAFRGKDVVLVSTGDFHNAAAIATPLIDAAIEAGVARFIPSGWGLDLYSGPGSWQEVMIPKHKVRDYLNKKATEGKITWTTVGTGLFYDWAFYLGLFNFDFAAKRVGIYDQGSQKIMMTTLDSIGDSVVGIMNNPDATKNKLVRIHDFFVDNLEVVRTVEQLTGVQYEMYTISTEEQTALAKAMSPSDNAARIAVLALFWGKARTAEWELPRDSELVGLKIRRKRQGITYGRGHCVKILVRHSIHRLLHIFWWSSTLQ